MNDRTATELPQAAPAVGARLEPGVVPLAPKRVQLSRAKGWRMPPNTVKVDRSTRWGNPYRWQDYELRAEDVPWDGAVEGRARGHTRALQPGPSTATGRLTQS